MGSRLTIGLLAAVPLTAVACSSSHHALPPAPAPSTTTTVAAPASSLPSTTAAPTTTTPPAAVTTVAPSGPPPCLTASLAGTLTYPNGTAGTAYFSLRLTNTAAYACVLDGYPGVSLVAAPGGAPIGAPAERTPGAATAVVLPPGGGAHAELGITDASDYGPGCGATQAAGLAVYPPGQTQALFVAHPTTGCSNRSDIVLRIGPLVPG